MDAEKLMTDGKIDFKKMAVQVTVYLAILILYTVIIGGLGVLGNKIWNTVDTVDQRTRDQKDYVDAFRDIVEEEHKRFQSQLDELREHHNEEIKSNPLGFIKGDEDLIKEPEKTIPLKEAIRQEQQQIRLRR